MKPKSASDTDETSTAIVTTGVTVRRKPVRQIAKKNVMILRIAVIVCIFAAASIVGYESYDVLRKYEYDEFVDEYNNLMDKLIPGTTAGLLDTITAVKVVGQMIGDIYPNNATWPLEVYDNFPTVAKTILPLSGASTMAFLPYVVPSEVSAFEDFAYDYYARHPDRYPADVATSDFGRGIWAFDPDSSYPDKHFHDDSGIVPNSTRQFLTPLLQMVATDIPVNETNKFLMINTRRVDSICSNAMDHVLECAEVREREDETCAMLTTSPHATDAHNPRALIMVPVFAANNMRDTVGFIISSVYFSDIIQSRIDRDVTGIDFVIHVHELILSYAIRNGKVVFKGEGDLHHPADDKYKRSVSLMDGVSGVAHCLTMNYDLTFYATEDFQALYRSQFRWVFCFGSVVIICFVSLVFLAYDWAMQRVTSEQQAVLDTKRQFVRFISHEVRTPLNAVSMASDLLRDQVLEIICKARESIKSGKSRLHWDSSNDSQAQTLDDALDLCEEIIGNTRNAVEVLDDLLNYDKIELGGLVLEPSFVALDHILELVIKPFNGPARKKEVTIVTDVSDFVQRSVFQGAVHGGKFSALRVLGDKVRLQQVIRNLVSNALKFTSPMGKITVTLSWVEGGLLQAALSPELAATLKTPTALSSTRRADYSFRSMTLNSFTSWSSSDAGKRGRKPSTAAVCVDNKADCASQDEGDGASVGDGLHSGNASMDGTAATSSGAHGISGKANLDKVVPEDVSAEYSRAKVVRGSYTRAPKDATTCVRYGSVRLIVTDDGAGMSPDQLQRVCSEGVQFNANELQAGQGSGLGLFIAKGIVVQHGGTLTVHSAGLRKGSSFIVELPVFACDLFSPWENRLLAQAQRTLDATSAVPPPLTAARSLGAGMLDRVMEVGESNSVSFRQPNRNEPSVAPTTASNSLKDLSSKPSEMSQRKAAEPVGGVVIPAAVIGMAPRHAPAQQPYHRSSKRCVLVVDDVPSNLKMSTRLLKHRGVERCVQAENGQMAVDTYLAARAALQEQAAHAMDLQSIEEGGESISLPTLDSAAMEPFDAILMDFEMPVMNGPTATTKLRELGCKVPIVGISGNVLAADVKIFMDSGATAVLPKPLNFDDLENAWSR